MNGAPLDGQSHEAAAAGTAPGSVRLSFARGLYHEVGARLTRELGAAHLVFGPNAGAQCPVPPQIPNRKAFFLTKTILSTLLLLIGCKGVVYLLLRGPPPGAISRRG